jgi:hypothetical protein
VFRSEKQVKVAIAVGGVVGDGPGDKLEWRSACESGACVQVTSVDEIVIMRVSTAAGVTVTMTRTEWEAFINAAKDGRLDDV